MGRNALKNHGLTHKRYTNDEDFVIETIDDKSVVTASMTSEEKWAVQLVADVMQGRKEASDSELKKARKLLQKFHKEIATQNMLKRIADASIASPFEELIPMMPYILPKAPTEIELKVDNKDLSDEELNEKLRLLLASSSSVME